jgi:hypothetical protein
MRGTRALKIEMDERCTSEKDWAVRYEGGKTERPGSFLRPTRTRGEDYKAFLVHKNKKRSTSIHVAFSLQIF